jgi:NAD(P)-dependent dehydrogenase (short-subunit alcohol dehydrogenase family)
MGEIPTSTLPGKTVLITGANAGIGKEIARQLAQREDTARIYLACRNPDRAQAAKTELEAATRRSIFDVVIMDLSDTDSVRSAARTIDGPIDALIMNAGSTGDNNSMALTQAGATNLFAANVLGHVALLDALLAADLLGEVAVFAGSEAARGIPKMRMKRPAFKSNSVDELASVIDSPWGGRKVGANLSFGQVKYIGALWMASLARRHPDHRFITISPGSTSGTEAPNSLPLPTRFAAKYVMPAIGARLGLSHDLETGARRFVGGQQPHPAERSLLRQRRGHHRRACRRPSGHLPGPGQHVLPGQRQRGHPPLHHLMTFA